MTQSTRITTSGGLISAAFIENIRELGARQRGIEPESFALPATEGSPRGEVGEFGPQEPRRAGTDLHRLGHQSLRR